ncbi:ATP-binding protein [Microlunatus parietis]|uniref:histidine kinase n=1 Tax=Microlunatus parietis TaxID=682979 RepID=A0A7Y9LC87_9ACTN|nr:ATP-binding protein [Microlunatus parietis]NYE70621.1 PAS domain S-box-containing protein [Microlunatus parietis]
MTESAGDPGSNSRQSRTRAFRRFTAWCVLAAACLLAELAVLTSPLPESTKVFSAHLLLTAGGLIVGLSAGQRIRSLSERRSRAWLMLALAGVICAAANLYELIESFNSTRTTTAIGNIGLAIGLVFGILAMISFPPSRRRGTDLARMMLDGVVVGGSILFFTAVMIYPPLLSTASLSEPNEVGLLVVSVGDVIVATLAVLLIMRSSGTDRPSLVLVGFGFALYAASDLTFALLTAQGTFSFGSWVDLGWIGGYALIALAARHPAAAQPTSHQSPREASPVAGTVIMFTIFIAAAFVGQLGAINPATNALWLIVLVAVAARQILLIIDNHALRRDLERRVAERTRDLRRLTEQSELLLKSVGDGIYGVDTSGRITFLNPAAARVLGYPPAELIGRSAHRTFHAPHPDGTRTSESQCYVTEAVRDGFAAMAEEDTYVRADGRHIPVEVTATPLTIGGATQNGQSASTRGAVVVFRDITQRREVDRIKNEFVSMVSHELRTPLTSIRGSLGLLAGGALGDLPERADQLITIAQQSCERLTRLINDILDIERFESGTIPMEIGEHRAPELIASAIRQVDLVAADAEVRLRIGRADGIVVADADRVLQALINLISNAVKFSKAGDEVLIAAVPRGGFVEFSITDHGRGIPPDKLDSIFNRFEQVDSSDSREKGGSGLGLAISRSIVERLGGRIWARSDPDRGTIFTFTLPRAERSVPAGQEDHPTVLVCDDDDYAVEVMCRLLEARGYHAVGVTDGQAAIERALTDPPDVVVLDLAMPGTSGADVIAALGRHSATRRLPVVVVSGLSPTGSPEIAAKVAGWLVKPIDEERLAHTVRSVLADKPAENTVLVVEDDDDLASNVTSLLERRGLTVHQAPSVSDGLGYFERGSPSVVVIDLKLRDGAGGDLLTVLRQRGAQGLSVVGYGTAEGELNGHAALPGGRAVFLTTVPVSAQQLEDSVIELLDAGSGTPARAAPMDPSDLDRDDGEEVEAPRPRRALDVTTTNP